MVKVVSVQRLLVGRPVTLDPAFSGGSAQDAAFAGAAGAGGASFPGPVIPDYSVDPYFQYDPNGFSNSTYGLGISCNEKGPG